MDHSLCHLMLLNRDLLADIAARLDGPSLAAVACTCSELREVAQDQRLWIRLCHSLWPSMNEAKRLVSFSAAGKYDKFFGDAYSTISYELCRPLEEENYFSSSDFASLVDIYYKNRCVFSRVIEGIPDMDICNDSETTSCRRWFSAAPFKVNLLHSHIHDQTDYEDEMDYNRYNYNEGGPPLVSNYGTKMVDQRGELIEDFRLSWVLLNKRSKKSVNLSSWKPLLVQRSWPWDGEYTMHFGCIIPVEDMKLPHKLAKCIIVATCKLGQRDERPNWKEISLGIEDMSGACVTGRKGLTVLNRAANGTRVTNHMTVKQGFDHYGKLRREMRKRKAIEEKLADIICVTIEAAVFLFFCYHFILSV